jgi:hypothetical protein
MCGCGDEGDGQRSAMLRQYENLSREGQKALVQLLMNTRGSNWTVLYAVRDVLKNPNFAKNKKSHCICTYAIKKMFHPEHGGDITSEIHYALLDTDNAAKYGFKYQDRQRIIYTEKQ